jgi:hypothetical protein
MPEIPFIVIYSGNDSHDVPGGIYTVHDQAEMEAFWPRLQTRQRPPAPPSVPWRDAVVLFVLLGVRPNGGYRLEVERVTPAETGIRVHAVEITYPNNPATQALISPYQMIKVSRFEGPAELVLRSEAR